MKIVFLDIDGVLNIPPTEEMDQECLRNLYLILDQTGAQVVVASTWRTGNLEATKRKMVGAGFSEAYIGAVIGETCFGYAQVVPGARLPLVRGNEIKAWEDCHLKYTWLHDPSRDEDFRLYEEGGTWKTEHCRQLGRDYEYIILDDHPDMLLEQADRFIRTDDFTGLTLGDAEKAIALLNSLEPAAVKMDNQR